MASAPIEKVIKAAVDRGASDIHIKAGDLIRARIGGRLVALTRQRLTPAQTRSIAARLVGAEEDRARLERLRDFDCSWGLPGVGRFRVSVLRQRSSMMIVLRVIPFAVPSLEELGLPDVLGSLVEHPSGLVLVGGASGSGASSTIAAMLHHLNHTTERHIVTVEDPIEFLHRDLRSSVTQREVGIDTDSVLTGIQAALRHDADVIVAGDIRDGATIATAIRAAETGALVIGAVHAKDVADALARVTALLPPEERDGGRARVAEVLRGVVMQRLLPRAEGEGRVAAVEVLVASPAVRDWVRQGGRPDALAALMGREAAAGTQTFAAHVAQLVAAGVVAAEGPDAAAPARPERGGAARGRR